jgi:hypothetical protein
MVWFLISKTEFSFFFPWILKYNLIHSEIWKIVLIKKYRDRPKTWLHIFLVLPIVSELLQCVQQIWYTTNDISQNLCLISLSLFFTFWHICKKTCRSISRLPLCTAHLYSYCTECLLYKPVFMARDNNTNWLLNITYILSVFRFIIGLQSVTYHSALKLCRTYCQVNSPFTYYW